MPLDITDWKTPANIVANVVADRLSSKFTLATNLFVGFMPADIDNCVAIIDTGGGEQDSVNAIDHLNFQVYSKNQSYQVGYNLQNLIKSELQSISQTVLDEEIIIGIWVKSNIASLGRDQSDNHLFSSNYRIMIDTKKDVNRMQSNGTYVTLDGPNANGFVTLTIGDNAPIHFPATLEGPIEGFAQLTVGDTTIYFPATTTLPT